MGNLISVITPSLPSRGLLLENCVQSVQHQLGEPFAEHLIEIDGHQAGPAEIRNKLAHRAIGRWLLFLDDDDVLMPNYTSTVVPRLLHAEKSTAVVYTAWRVVGDLAPQPLLRFHPELIRAGRNHVPVTACVRADTFHAAGGFRNTDELEDLGLWQRILDAGHDFDFIPVETWEYRRDAGVSRNRETIFGPDGCARCGCRGCGSSTRLGEHD